MLQPFSYRHIAGHLVPGIIMLVAIILICEILSSGAISTYIKSNPNNLLGGGVLFLIASITLGLVADGIRYGIEDVIMKKSERRQQRNLYAGVNEKNFESFKYVYENSYPFYQFYSNMCVSLLVLACALPWYFRKILNQKYKHTWWIALSVIFIIFLLHVLAAKRAYKKYNKAIEDFFPPNITA